MEKDPDFKLELDDEEEELEEAAQEEEEETAASTRSSRSRSVPGRARKTSSGEIATDRSSSLRSTRLSVNPDFAAKHRRFLNRVSDSLVDDGNGKRAGRSRDRSDQAVGHAGRSRERSAKSASRAGKSQDRSGKSLDRSGKSQDRSGKSQDRSGKSQDRSGKLSVTKSEDSSDKLVRKSSQDELNKKPSMELNDSNDKSTDKPGGSRSSQDGSDKIPGKISVKTLDTFNKSTDKTGGRSSQDGSDKVPGKISVKSLDTFNKSTDKPGGRSSQDGSDKIPGKISVKSLDTFNKSTDKIVISQDGSDEIPDSSTAISQDSLADASMEKSVTLSSQDDSDEVLDKSQDSSENSTVNKSSQDGSDAAKSQDTVKKPDEPKNSRKDTSGETTDDDDDDTPLRAIRSRSRMSETRKRDRESDEGGEEKEKEVEKESPKKKKRSQEKSSDAAPKPIREGKDMYCWKCHREGTIVACKICPRVFHLRCLHLETAPPLDWVCPECSTTLYAENTETRSTAMKSLTLDQLCNLLKFTLARMNSYPGAEWFIKPVDTSEFKDYRKFVVNPMDLSHLEKNIKQKVYGSTHAFYADAQWLLHNSVIFNSHQSKMSNIAKVLVKICKQELDEIETCPECYLNAHTRKDSWFIEACKRPHILVWAKLKGFPFWPAKAMKTNADNLVDVRFFGAHDRAWIPIKFVYLYSKLNPCSSKNKRKSQFDDCILEVQQYIKKLRDRFGEFVYPPFKSNFDASKEEEQLEAMLPGYKAASRRYGKLLGPFRNFSLPTTSSHNEVKKELSDSAKRKLTPEKRKTNEDNLSSQDSSKSAINNDKNRDMEEENDDDNSGKKDVVEEANNEQGKKSESHKLSPKSDPKVRSTTDPTRGGEVTVEKSIKKESIEKESSNKEDGDENVRKKRNNDDDDDDDDDDEPLAKRRPQDESGEKRKIPEKSPTKTDYAASLQEKLQLMLKKEAVNSFESNSEEMAVGDDEEEKEEEDEEETMKKKKKEKENEVSSKSGGDKEGDEDDADLGSNSDDVNSDTTTEREKNVENNERGSKESEKDTDKDKEKDDERAPTKEKKVDNDEGSENDTVKDKEKDGMNEERTLTKDDCQKKLANDKEKDIDKQYTFIKTEVEEVDDSSTAKEVEEVQAEEQSATPHIDLTTDDDDDQETNKTKPRLIVCDLKKLTPKVENDCSKEFSSKVVVEQPKPKVLDTIRATIEEVVQNASFLCSRKIEATRKLTGIVNNLNQFPKGLERLSRNSSITIAKTESVIDCDDDDDLDIDNPKLISLLRARDPSCVHPEDMERAFPTNRRKGFPSKVRRTGSTASSSCSSDMSSVDELKRICAEQELRGENDRKRKSTTPIDEDDSYSVLDEVSGQFMKKRMEKGNVTITLVSDDESPSKQSTNNSQPKGSVSLSKDVSLSIVRDDTKNLRDLSLDMECVESDTDEIEKIRRGNVSSNNSIHVKPTARKSFPNSPNFGNKTTVTKTRDGGSEMTRRLYAAEIQVMNQQNGGRSSSSPKVSPSPSPKNQVSASSAFHSKISKNATNPAGSEEVQISNTISMKVHAVEPSSPSKSATGNKPSPPATIPLTSFNVVSTSCSVSATVAPISSTSSSSSSLSRPQPTAVTQAARVLPQLQLKPPAPAAAASTSGRSLLRGNFGPATGRMDAMSQRLSENMMTMMEDMLQEMAQEGRFEARLKQMQIEMERNQWKYRQEMAEYKHNTDLMIMEMRAGFEAERHRAIMEVRIKCQAEKEAAINETKMKQWCALCKKEALFYCCWNTAYCNYPCQQEHWPQHMANCAQTNRANQDAAAKTTSSVKMLTAPFTTTTTTAGQKTVSIPPTQNHLQVAATTTLMTSSTAVAAQESANKSLMQHNSSLMPLHHSMPPAVTMPQPHHMVNPAAGGMRMVRAPVMVRPPMNFTIRPPQHFMVTPRGPLPHPGFFQ